jgi:hypothetical protein
MQNIEVVPPVAIDLGPDSTACADAVVFDAGLENVLYEWKKSGSSQVDTTRIFSARSSGTYFLTVTDACGNIDKDTVVLALSGGCVWPGDVNSDGKVDMMDFICLGEVNGQTGTSRAMAGTDWASEYSADWGAAWPSGHPFAADVDLKHADCNGDGVIDLATDGQVILDNAGFSYVHEVPADTEGVMIIVEPVNFDKVAEDTFHIEYDVSLYNGLGGNVPELYAFAFSLDYNLSLSNTPQWTAESSWMGSVSDLIIHHDSSNTSVSPLLASRARSVEVGISGTNQSNRSGAGKVGKLDFIVTIDEINEDNDLLGFSSFSLTPGNVLVTDKDGNLIPVSGMSSSATSSVRIHFACDGDAAEPDNRSEQADTLSDGEILSDRRICSVADEDFFLLDLPVGKNGIEVILYDMPADFDMELRDSEGNVVETAVLAGLDADTLLFTGLPGESYYVRVFGKTQDDWDAAQNYSIRFTASGDPSFPVILTGFEGWEEAGAVELEWSVSREVNNEKFLLSRSHDGLIYEQIAAVDGKGNTGDPQTYHFRDTHPVEGINLYRLSQRDYDGMVRILSTIEITHSGQGFTRLYPNPATSVCYLEMLANKLTTARVSVLDLSGRSLFQAHYSLLQGLNKLEVPLSELEYGMYLIQVETEEALWSKLLHVYNK